MRAALSVPLPNVCDAGVAVCPFMRNLIVFVMVFTVCYGSFLRGIVQTAFRL